MKLTLSLLMLVAIFPLKSISGEPDLHHRWCQETGRVLEVTLREAYWAQSFSQEKELLKNGIERSLEYVNSKFTPYFQQTLAIVDQALPLYKNEEQQVYFLRRQIKNALDDLYYLDKKLRKRTIWCNTCLGDHSEYVITVLDRSLREGVSVLEDNVESNILDLAAQQSQFLLENSRNRRSYICAQRKLAQALETSFIQLKRSIIREAIYDVSNASYCD